MGKPYAEDLILVVVLLMEAGHTQRENAELCEVSLGSVERYLRRYRTSDSVSPDKFGSYEGYALIKHTRGVSGINCAI